MPKIGSYFPFSKSDKALVNFNQTRSLTLAQASLFDFVLPLPQEQEEEEQRQTKSSRKRYTIGLTFGTET